MEGPLVVVIVPYFRYSHLLFSVSLSLGYLLSIVRFYIFIYSFSVFISLDRCVSHRNPSYPALHSDQSNFFMILRKNNNNIVPLVQNGDLPCVRAVLRGSPVLLFEPIFLWFKCYKKSSVLIICYYLPLKPYRIIHFPPYLLMVFYFYCGTN